MHLVGFIIRIYHVARSPERQKVHLMFSLLAGATDFSCFPTRKNTSGGGPNSVMDHQDRPVYQEIYAREMRFNRRAQGAY